MSCSESPWKPWLPRVYSILSWDLKESKFQRYKGWDRLIVYRPSCHKNCNNSQKFVKLTLANSNKTLLSPSLHVLLFFLHSSETNITNIIINRWSAWNIILYQPILGGFPPSKQLVETRSCGVPFKFTQSERYCKMSGWLVRDDDFLLKDSTDMLYCWKPATGCPGRRQWWSLQWRVRFQRLAVLKCKDLKWPLLNICYCFCSHLRSHVLHKLTTGEMATTHTPVVLVEVALDP